MSDGITDMMRERENEKSMPRFDSPKNWTEDYKLENGNYTCKCYYCGEYFFGHKRRFVCKECTEQIENAIEKAEHPQLSDISNLIYELKVNL